MRARKESDWAGRGRLSMPRELPGCARPGQAGRRLRGRCAWEPELSIGRRRAFPKTCLSSATQVSRFLPPICQPVAFQNQMFSELAAFLS
jgi:hypothetical protein